MKTKKDFLTPDEIKERFAAEAKSNRFEALIGLALLAPPFLAILLGFSLAIAIWIMCGVVLALCIYGPYTEMRARNAKRDAMLEQAREDETAYEAELERVRKWAESLNVPEPQLELDLSGESK